MSFVVHFLVVYALQIIGAMLTAVITMKALDLYDGMRRRMQKGQNR